MTIAQAFNEIAVAQGGTASTSGTVAGAIDALNDALAGSDQPAEQSIEAAVRLLGQHIGGGGGGIELGTPQTVVFGINVTGQGKDLADQAADVCLIKAGEYTVYDGEQQRYFPSANNGSKYAAGLTLKIRIDLALQDMGLSVETIPNPTLYDEYEDGDDLVYDALPGIVTMTTTETDEIYLEFIVPELAQGHIVVPMVDVSEGL